jgi:hypothetical protein
MSNQHVREPFRSLLSDIRDATQTLANCAAKGALKPDGTRTMSRAYIRSTPDDDPEYMTSEEERDAELAAREKTIEELETALENIAAIAGDYGDGAPDDHYLAHVMLEIETIAKNVLDEVRGTHRKALEAIQKRQQP